MPLGKHLVTHVLREGGRGGEERGRGEGEGEGRRGGGRGEGEGLSEILRDTSALRILCCVPNTLACVNLLLK